MIALRGGRAAAAHRLPEGGGPGAHDLGLGARAHPPGGAGDQVRRGLRRGHGVEVTGANHSAVDVEDARAPPEGPDEQDVGVLGGAAVAGVESRAVAGAIAGAAVEDDGGEQVGAVRGGRVRGRVLGGRGAGRPVPYAPGVAVDAPPRGRRPGAPAVPVVLGAPAGSMGHGEGGAGQSQAGGSDSPSLSRRPGERPSAGVVDQLELHSWSSCGASALTRPGSC